MRQWVPFVFACFGLVGCSQEPQYQSVQFGTFSRDDDRIIFQAQTRFSRAKEPTIGWAFDIAGSPERITIREVISGPPGTVWPSVDAGALSDGGRTVSVTAEVKKPGPTHLFHNWTFDSSEVVGSYEATLFIDERLIKVVHFVLTE